MFIDTPCPPRSARPCLRCRSVQSSRPLQTGFTLLEIMVVIAIIGVLFSLASLSIGSNDGKKMEAEAQRLSALIQLAGEEAIINTREMILEVGQNQYQFLVLGEEGFAPMDADNAVFRSRELPEYLSIELELEDQKVDFTQLESDDLPKIGIFSSGEMTPFVINIVREDGLAFGFDGDFLGNVHYLGKTRDAEL